MDHVLVTSLHVDCLDISPAPWADSRHQLSLIDVAIETDTSRAGATDDLTFSINYSGIAKGLRSHFSTAASTAKQQEEASSLSKSPDPLLATGGSQASAWTAYTIAQEAARWLLFELEPPLRDRDAVNVKVHVPEALLHGGNLYAAVRRARSDYTPSTKQISHAAANARLDSLSIEGWQISTVIGLNDCERQTEQPVVVEVETWPNYEGLQASDSMAWSAKALQATVWSHVRSNNPLLLEKLCPTTAQAIIGQCGVPRTRVRVDKPKAVLWTSTTAVQVIRHRNDHLLAQGKSGSDSRYLRRASSSKISQDAHTAYIALGSNVGNRVANIRKALAGLQGPDPQSSTGTLCKVLDVSFLYESEPMYVLEQDRFLNAVCKISTHLAPVELLSHVKSVESAIGRRKTIDKGPREIDLDILLYDDVTVFRDDDADLTIPHPLISEREFVLQPLADISPRLQHPIFRQSIRELLAALPRTPASGLRQVVPIPSSGQTLQMSPSSRTLIMSILNVTPDSFSDGGSYGSVDSAVQAALSHVQQGADVIDIGGVSTRPGSAHVTEEEELQRVIPVIEAIRKGLASDGVHRVPISVDTYRASVAEKSIQAGADIINDISGGLHDPLMLATVAQLDVPFVLMHMRGKPEEVNNPHHQRYENGDVVGGVRRELAATVRKALAAGIRRWNIILDPGISFSKDINGNLALLRHLPAVTGRATSSSSPFASSDVRQAGDHRPRVAGAEGLLLTQEPEQLSQSDHEDAELLSGFPVLVGVSRKGFIGKITEQPEPKEREFGNSAIHALAIANGANVLRVHDVRAARDAVRITDAIYGRS